MKIVSIVGDSLSMVRPWEDIQYKDTYVFKLQELLGSEYHVTNFNQKANTVLKEYNLLRGGDGMLYSNPDLIIFHLGIVDCAPRLFGLKEQKIIECLNFSIFKIPLYLLFKFKSKHRLFFTKHFQKTYISKKTFKEKMEFIIKQIRIKTDSKIFIVNIADTTEFNKNRSYNYHENIIDYNKILEDLVNENKDLCTLINFYEITKHENNKVKYLLSDGNHLSKEGHKILSKLLYQKIKDNII